MKKMYHKLIGEFIKENSAGKNMMKFQHLLKTERAKKF